MDGCIKSIIHPILPESTIVGRMRLVATPKDFNLGQHGDRSGVCVIVWHKLLKDTLSLDIPSSSLRCW